MTTFTIDQDIFRKVCQVKWSFSTGSGLQEGAPFDSRGWEILSAEFYSPSTYLPKSSIQISNESATAAYTDVAGLVISAPGTVQTPQMMKPSSSAVTMAPVIRAVVDDTLTNPVAITVYLRVSQ